MDGFGFLPDGWFGFDGPATATLERPGLPKRPKRIGSGARASRGSCGASGTRVPAGDFGFTDTHSLDVRSDVWVNKGAAGKCGCGGECLDDSCGCAGCRRKAPAHQGPGVGMMGGYGGLPRVNRALGLNGGRAVVESSSLASRSTSAILLAVRDLYRQHKFELVHGSRPFSKEQTQWLLAAARQTLPGARVGKPRADDLQNVKEWVNLLVTNPQLAYGELMQMLGVLSNPNQLLGRAGALCLQDSGWFTGWKCDPGTCDDSCRARGHLRGKCRLQGLNLPELPHPGCMCLCDKNYSWWEWALGLAAVAVVVVVLTVATPGVPDEALVVAAASLLLTTRIDYE